MCPEGVVWRLIAHMAGRCRERCSWAVVGSVAGGA